MKDNARDLGMTWTTGGTARAVAIYAGYPVLEPDNVVSMPVARSILAERRRQQARLFAAPDDELLRTLRIRWVIFSCEEFAKFAEPVKAYVSGLKSLPGAVDLSVGGSAPGCYRVLKLPKS